MSFRPSRIDANTSDIEWWSCSVREDATFGERSFCVVRNCSCAAVTFIGLTIISAAAALAIASMAGADDEVLAGIAITALAVTVTCGCCSVALLAATVGLNALCD